MKSIAIDEQAHKQVKAVCKTLDLNIGEFVLYSANYFKKTGIDPSKDESESPHKIVKELERRIGQVVAYIKTHEQDKLNPLLEDLVILIRQMEDMIAKAPKAQRFEDVMKIISNLLASQDQKHQKQVGLIMQSQDQVKNETADSIKKLTASLNELRSEQQKIKEVIDTKLSKKYFN